MSKVQQSREVMNKEHKEHKDIADLFAREGEGSSETVESLIGEASDALGLFLSEAPQKSREKFTYAKDEIIPLIMKLGDGGERRAALDDVASSLKLQKKGLREALERAEAEERDRLEKARVEEAEDSESLTPPPDTERYEKAMEILQDGDILELAASEMERLGHVGEFVTKKLCFICAISAMAGYPIQPSTHAESSSGKNFLWDTVLSLFPEEMVIKRSAISAKALFRTEQELKGAILYLQEIAGSEDADFAIRVLQSDGKLIYEATEKDEEGAFVTVVHEKEGPTVVVQTTTKSHLFHENETRVFSIYLDESMEQTRRIVENTFRIAEIGDLTSEEKAVITESWKDAIRLLEPARVRIPFASRIEFPSHQVRVRRDAPRLLNVISIVAWVHQYSREYDDEYIVAEEEDFHKAVGLVSDSLNRAWKILSPKEERVLEAIGRLQMANRSNGFRKSDVEVEGIPDRSLQGILKSLTESGYLDCDGKRGPQGYTYALNREAEKGKLGISLRAVRDEDESSSTEPETIAQAVSARFDATPPSEASTEDNLNHTGTSAASDGTDEDPGEDRTESEGE